MSRVLSCVSPASLANPAAPSQLNALERFALSQANASKPKSYDWYSGGPLHRLVYSGFPLLRLLRLIFSGIPLLRQDLRFENVNLGFEHPKGKGWGDAEAGEEDEMEGQDKEDEEEDD